MKNNELKVELLKDISPKGFEPYGQIIGIEKGKPLEDFPYLRYWPKNIDLGTDDEEIDVGLLVCKRIKNNNITKLERHKRTFEVLFPLGGDSIWVVAPSKNEDEEPDLSMIRAFYLDGSLGMSLHKGTWHWAPVCLKETVKFSVLLKGGLEDPTDYYDLDFEIKLLL